MLIRKKEGIAVTACRLGEDSELERLLIKEGKLKLRPGGYEVFSREAVNGSGELARTGDYVKLDGAGRPYPNESKFFLENHEPGPGGFVQKPKLLKAWQRGEEKPEELIWLLDRGILELRCGDSERYFNATLWDAPLSAPKDAVIVFYDVEREPSGTITRISFNFLCREELENNYEIL